MKLLTNLLKKLGIGGALALAIIVFVGLFIASPFLLILGLNLLGFSIPYTFKTFLGAIVVILIMRPTSSSTSS